MRMGTRRAVAPFEFYTLAQVTRPENHSASTLGELLDALEKCSDESIFHHAVQAPGSHELLAAGGSNDSQSGLMARQCESIWPGDWWNWTNGITCPLTRCAAIHMKQ